MPDTNLLRFLQQENARLKEENKRLSEQVQTLTSYLMALDELEQAVRHMSNEQDLMSLLDKVLAYALNVLNATDGSLLLTDEETGDLVFVVVQGQKRQVLPGYRIRGDEGIAGWVATHGQPAIVDQARSDPRFLARVDEAFDFETRSLICVPLIARQKTLGVLEVINKASNARFTEADLHLLSILAMVAAMELDAIARQPEK